MKKINLITYPAVVLMLLSTGAGIASANTNHQASFSSNITKLVKRTTNRINSNRHPVVVKNVQQLRKALKNDSHYILIDGYINGNVDKKTGRNMTAKDYAKNTDYNFNQYLKDYNPKTSKNEPAGKQENARKEFANRQKENVELKVPSNTRIVGTKNAKLSNVNLIVQGRNVIIRNLTMQAPTDDFPG